MADKSMHMILAALSRAAATGEAPLYTSKTCPGLFPATAAGKQAALRSQEDGFLALTRPEPADPAPSAEGPGATLVKKKTSAVPTCRITPQGLTYLLSQVSPRQVLEDLVRALEAREDQMTHLLQTTRRMQQDLEAVRSQAAAVLQQVQQAELGMGQENGASGGLKALFSDFRQEKPGPAAGPEPAADLAPGLLAELERWQAAGASEDCPLPYLFRQLQAKHPTMTIGQLHDTLRRLHDTEQVYLHPWTGPLYDIPEPPYAILIGHEIAYYASRRGG